MTNAQFVGWDYRLGRVLQIGKQQWFPSIPEIMWTFHFTKRGVNSFYQDILFSNLFKVMLSYYVILLMEEILHHLGYIPNPVNNGDKTPISTGYTTPDFGLPFRSPRFFPNRLHPTVQQVDRSHLEKMPVTGTTLDSWRPCCCTTPDGAEQGSSVMDGSEDEGREMILPGESELRTRLSWR